MSDLWVSWDRASRAHLAVGGVSAADVRNGDFPLACGAWAPSGFDAEVSTSTKRRCSRCAATTRPAPRASISEEENMAGKPDPKPTPSKAPSKSKTKSAASTPQKRSQAASKPEATPETTPEPTPETETTPESQPEPIVELPSRDAAPADLATSVVEYVEEATEATIERVPTPSGGEERFRVDGKTVAYVAVGKRGVSVKVGLQSGKRERITVKTSDDVAAAGRSLVETLDLLARQTAEAQEEAVAS